MNKKIDELVGKLRELLAVSTDDAIAKMRTVAEEMLGPEEHECWLTGQPTHVTFWCSCGKADEVAHAKLDAMYNAMRHLTPELLGDAADELYEDRLGGDDIGDINRLRAAAAAMRRASK